MLGNCNTRARPPYFSFFSGVVAVFFFANNREGRSCHWRVGAGSSLSMLKTMGRGDASKSYISENSKTSRSMLHMHSTGRCIKCSNIVCPLFICSMWLPWAAASAPSLSVVSLISLMLETATAVCARNAFDDVAAEVYDVESRRCQSCRRQARVLSVARDAGETDDKSGCWLPLKLKISCRPQDYAGCCCILMRSLQLRSSRQRCC